jgi:hypothetical protein
MPTNKVVLRTTEEFMADYTPIYRPLYPLFMGKAKGYTEEVGKIDFKRVDTIGDIRAKHITPKDTEIRQIGVKEGSKTFKKYFLANQFTQSALQDQRGTEDVVAQVLDEHQKQFDELFSLGEGSADNNVVNNGLFWSGDSNHVTNGSYEVLEDAGDNYLVDLHGKVMSVASEQADLLSGRKVVLFYGSSIVPLFNGLYPNGAAQFKTQLSAALGGEYSIAKMPSTTYASGANGFLIANLDQVIMHYCALPSLKAQGVNDEKMYSWHNFMMGSSMLECLASGAIIKQPLTLSSL